MKAPLFAGSARKRLFWSVGRRLRQEPGGPDRKADDRDHAEAFADRGRDRRQRGGQRQAHPESLQGPGVQKADERRLDGVETGVLARLADAAEQVAAEARRPDHDQREQHVGPGIGRRPQHDRDDRR